MTAPAERELLSSPAAESADLILIPVFNDWQSLATLIGQLDSELSAKGRKASLLILDDSSTDQLPADLVSLPPTALESVDVLSLARNLGHQRALAVGLSYVAANRESRAVVVMDADGEDLAADVPRLLDRFDGEQERVVVFAQRTRRSEGLVFTLFYRLYRLVHLLLTGIRVEVGNFSVIPRSALKKLVVSSDLWNHYAAAVMQSRLPVVLVPTVRGRRLSGRTHMGFVSLVGHGLSAMSVFADRIGVRLLISSLVLITLLVIALGVTLAIRFLTHYAIPGWTTLAFGVLSILLGQAAMLAVMFIFMIQGGRARSSFIPAREYEPFVDSVKRLFP